MPTARAVAIAMAVMTFSLGKALAQSNSSATAPDTPSTGMVGWVPPDARRSTWDIIWSCLSIFLVCSWKCVHLNAPSPEESRGGWHTFAVGKKLTVRYFPERPLRTKWVRKLRWMFWISIAPEVGVALAVKQWTEARLIWKLDGKKAGLSMAHAFLANMGGIRMQYISVSESRDQEPSGADTSNPVKERASPVISSLDISRVEEQPPGDVENPTQGSFDNEFQKDIDISPPVEIVCPLAQLSRPGVILIPTEGSVQGQSKSDAFTKLFAIVQSTWLIIQSIARVYRGFAITQLELVTIAFVFCAVLMYGFWWHKPFDLAERYSVVRVVNRETSLTFGEAGLVKTPKGRGEYAVDRNKLELEIKPDDFPILVPCLVAERVPEVTVDQLVQLVVKNDVMVGVLFRPESWPVLALYLSGTAFCALHLAAWNWKFPSPLIQALWRWFAVAALAASCLPFLLFLSVQSLGILYGWLDEPDWMDLVVGFVALALTIVMVVVYVVARLVLLFLTFYCFYSMPASVYQKVEWTGFLPHFS